MMVTDGPTTTITLDSPVGRWMTEVYMVPCASDAAQWDADMMKGAGVTGFVPDIFCELSDELDEIACDAYLHGERLGPANNLKPMFPPHCRSPK